MPQARARRSVGDGRGEGRTDHDQRLRPALFNAGERRFDSVSRSEIDRQNGHPELACGEVQRFHVEFDIRITDGANNGHSVEIRYDFFEDLHSFRVCLGVCFGGYAGHLSAGVSEALHEPDLHRETDRDEHRRHIAGQVFRRQCCYWSPDDQQVGLRRQGNDSLLYSVGLRTGKAGKQHDISTIDITEVGQALLQHPSEFRSGPLGRKRKSRQ